MIVTDSDKCLRCGGCVGVCPATALDLTEHGLVCDGSRCTSCRACVQFCPVGAIKLMEHEEGGKA